MARKQVSINVFITFKFTTTLIPMNFSETDLNLRLAHVYIKLLEIIYYITSYNYKPYLFPSYLRCMICNEVYISYKVNIHLIDHFQRHNLQYFA